MKIEIKEVINVDEKSYICKKILIDMRRWHWIASTFSNDSIDDHSIAVRTMLFYAAYTDKKAIGFAAIDPFSKDISLMVGILKAYRRQGVEEALVKHCEEFCGKSLKIVEIEIVPD